MTALATPPKLQFLDSNGAPLVGGKLYTYAAGTTTPQVTYTDYVGGTPNANPVILDSRGEASVWLGTALYKMALYSATDVLIWTVDNIGGFATLAQLAASGGSNLIGYLPAGTGAVATTVQTALRWETWAEGFGLSAGASDATNKAAIQAAIDAAYAAGGGTVYMGTGDFSCSDGIQIKQQVSLVGAGIGATRLIFTGTGDGIYTAYPINSSTAAWNQIKNLEIYNANASNTGGGYVDVGGTYVYLENVYVNGFKYGVIFDQTELADIDLCNFGNNITGGVWLVNGAAHTVGALGVFTNRISVNRCQFNNGSTSYGIIDDGGYSHSFNSNNFNHCYTALRSAGTQGLSITNNYFEGQTNFCIDFQTTTVAGVGCGSNTSTVVLSNLFVPVVANTAVNAAYAGYLSFINNDFATASTPVKIAIGTVAQLVEIGNRSGGGAGALTGGSPSWQFKVQDTGTFTPSVAFSGASVGITYTTQSGQYTRVGNVVTFSINITLSNKGSSVGTLQITGLPYQSVALNQIISAPYIDNVLGGITTAASNIPASGTLMNFFNAAVNASNVFFDTNVSNNTTINVTGSYLAS